MAAGRSDSPKKAGQSYSVLGQEVGRDVIGVILIVIAVVLFMTLYSSSDAIITSGIRLGLTRGFGTGAILIPLMFIFLGVTFFLPSDASISTRNIIGMSLIVVAILSFISITWPGADLMPESVLREPALSQTGGYVGGGIAWLLLELFGKTIGIVLLLGMILTGIVICGFSVSSFLVHLKDKAREMGGRIGDIRREFTQGRQEAFWPEYPQAPTQAPDMTASPETGSFEESPTAFIGHRKTTVLHRPEATRVMQRNENDAHDPTDQQEVPVAQYETPVDQYEAPHLENLENYAVNRGDTVPVPTPVVHPNLEATSELPHSDTTKKLQPYAHTGAGQKDTQTKAQQDTLPPVSLLYSSKDTHVTEASNEELNNTANRLQSTLNEFGLTSRVEGWVSGPSVTTFRVSMGEGERVSKITNLQDDIALSLAAKSVRIFSPIPGTSLVGVEIPNQITTPVLLGDVLPQVDGGPLNVAFGRDSEGSPVVVDLASLPHLLVAGTTGSGKSVFLNSIIMSILMRATPEQVRLILVDPKHVEFTFYDGLPHLYVPVVTDSRKAASALQWSVQEMERRLKVFERYRVRDIASYNSQCDAGRLHEDHDQAEHMPYFVIVIDELSDLMMVAGKDVEASIVRIAQLGRAAGIHLVVATQRPSADVVTGLIKANIDNRVALAVDNGMNSRIILDQNGAERLLGKGDMLYKLRGVSPRRAQSCYQSDQEIERVVSFVKEHAEADYHDEILSAAPISQGGTTFTDRRSDDDPLMWEAALLVVESQLGSTSALQRHLKVGYARAGRIMDILEQKGVVGPPDGSKPREVLLDLKGLEELRVQESAYKEV